MLALLAGGATGLRSGRGESKVLDETPINVTVTQGSTAVLPCSVDPQYTEYYKDYKVSTFRII